MVSEAVAKEARQGIIFTVRVGKQRFGRVPVQLFVEGQERPVGTVKVHPLKGSGGTVGLVDKAFQRWVTNGLFYKTVKDPSLRSVLIFAQRERLEDVLWYRRTFRFLQAEGSTYQNPRFILTTDKSDLSDRYKRILEVGENIVQREEAEQEEARKLRAKEERDREENLRTAYAQLIRAVAKMAINEKLVPADSIRTLSELGLLKPSTSFRGGALFPVSHQFSGTISPKRKPGMLDISASIPIFSFSRWTNGSRKTTRSTSKRRHNTSAISSTFVGSTSSSNEIDAEPIF